ncbi:hypothetical protein ACIQLJ_08495 [Microbacterium sp. NPDC091313]
MSDDKYRGTSAPVPLRTRTDAARRAADAWQMRVSGIGWDEIAARLGLHGAPNTHRAVKNYFGSVPQPDRELLRTMARERGEALWRRAFESVEKSEGSAAAIRVAVDVLRRQAALDGLDQPTQVEFTPTHDDLQRFVATVVAAHGLAAPEEGDPFAIVDAEVVEDESHL